MDGFLSSTRKSNPSPKKKKISTRKAVDKRKNQTSNSHVTRGSLHSAVQRGNITAVKAQLSRGLSADTADKLKRTLLHVASFNGDISMVKLLLKHNAKVDSRDYKGMTPIHLAAKAGHLKIFKLLVLHTRGFDKKLNINIKTNDNLTPLHFAAQKGHLPLINYIMKNGGEIEAKGDNSFTPLNYAFFGCQTKCFKELISYLPDFCKLPHYKDLLPLASSGFKYTIVNNRVKQVVASDAEQLEIYTEFVRILLDAGSNVNTLCKLGLSALHKAAAHAIPNIIRLLLNAGADVNKTSRLFGCTPLHYLSDSKNYRALSILIHAGADINARAPSGETHVTVLNSFNTKKDILFLYTLLNHGYDINARCRRTGCTPLHFLCYYCRNDGELPCCLLDWFLDFNVTNNDQETPLQFYMRISNSKKHAEFIIKVMAKMESNQKFQISALNMKIITENSYLDFYNDCKQELDDLKQKRVWGLVSFFDLLDKPLEKIRDYTRRDEFMSVVNAGVLDSFPVYGGLIEKRIGFAVSLRNLHIKSFNSLRKVFFPYNLPHIINNKILSFLNVDEMEMLSSI